jgi:ribonuclease HI
MSACQIRNVTAGITRMSVPAPHFLLFSESRLKRKDARQETELESGQTVGHWRFVLESLDGEEKFEADDEEPQTQGERLELLAVVRGLEALDQPSRVTLVTPSRYVSRGLRFGLKEWRESGWLWERFGEMAPVKNHDLWQRVDRALEFHEVECRTWHYDQSDELHVEENGETGTSGGGAITHARQKDDFWKRGLPGFCRELLLRLRQALQPSPREKGMRDAPLAAPQLQA